MDEFSTLWISKNLDIQLERLRVWIDRGYVVPSVQKAEGKGTKSLFDRLDLYSIVLFRHLIEDSNFPREKASQFLSTWLDAVKDNPIKAVGMYNVLIFIQDGEGVFFCQLFSILPPKDDYLQMEGIRYQAMKEVEGKDWKVIHIVNFDRIKREVDAVLT